MSKTDAVLWWKLIYTRKIYTEEQKYTLFAE